MKLKIQKRKPGTPVDEAILVQFCVAIDRSIPKLRTAFLIAGLIGAAMRTGVAADFLFATGLLFQMAMWFESWWRSLQSR